MYMRNQLLRDADWASMAHSLELRTPLVDIELLRAIAPMQHALSGKAILADAMGLESQVRDRPKTGFTTPVGKWISQSVESANQPWARSWANEVIAEFESTTTVAKPVIGSLPCERGRARVGANLQ